MRLSNALRHWYFTILILLMFGGMTIGNAPVFAATGNATSSAVPSNAGPKIGDQITVEISIDVSGVNPPDNALGSYSGSLNWKPDVLVYKSHSGGPPPGFTGVVNTGGAASGHIAFNGVNARGTKGKVTVLNVTFEVVGAGNNNLNLKYSSMAAASTFENLLPILKANIGNPVKSPVPAGGKKSWPKGKKQDKHK